MIPSLKEWDEKYREQGLVIIGNHYPEFSFEEDLTNLQAAIAEYGIEYAVAQDNDGATWRAYKNRYWPTLYLIDKNGHIRYVHVGEGRYNETEAAIQSLLADNKLYFPQCVAPALAIYLVSRRIYLVKLSYQNKLATHNLRGHSLECCAYSRTLSVNFK